MHEGGLAAGVLNIITGSGSVLGEPLVTDPRIAKVPFTGSTPVGKRVAELAAPDVKRVTLELGGSNPMIVLEDADLDAAASAASVGRFFNCGQACLAVKLLYVQEAVVDATVEKLREKVRRLRLGPGDQEGTMLGPLHSEEQRATLESQLHRTLAAGSDVMEGGARPEGEEYANGSYYEPTLILKPRCNSPVATEEVFGPALPIRSVNDLGVPIALSNESQFGLAGQFRLRAR